MCVTLGVPLSQGKPSPRTEVNPAEDPSEKTNLADKQPDKVSALQKVVLELSADQASPLFSVSTQELVGQLPPALPTRRR
jgi:hypothetical protein